MITAAPYGPMWKPQDCTRSYITWDEQVQVAKDSYNARATLLHIHVRDPKTGHILEKLQRNTGPDRAPAQRLTEDDGGNRAC